MVVFISKMTKRQIATLTVPYTVSKISASKNIRGERLRGAK